MPCLTWFVPRWLSQATVVTVGTHRYREHITATYAYPFEENASTGLFSPHSKRVGGHSGPPTISHHCFCSAAASGAMQERDGRFTLAALKVRAANLPSILAPPGRTPFVPHVLHALAGWRSYPRVERDAAAVGNPSQRTHGRS